MSNEGREVRSRVTKALADLDLTFFILHDQWGREWHLDFAQDDGSLVRVRIRIQEPFVLVFSLMTVPGDPPASGDLHRQLLGLAISVPNGSLAMVEQALVVSSSFLIFNLGAETLGAAIGAVNKLTADARRILEKAGVKVAASEP